MRACFNLTEMQRRLPVPSRQDGFHRQIGCLLKNLLQLPLHMLRNAFHDKPSMTSEQPPILRWLTILTENRPILLLTFLGPDHQTRKLICTLPWESKKTGLDAVFEMAYSRRLIDERRPPGECPATVEEET